MLQLAHNLIPVASGGVASRVRGVYPRFVRQSTKPSDHNFSTRPVILNLRCVVCDADDFHNQVVREFARGIGCHYLLLAGGRQIRQKIVDRGFEARSCLGIIFNLACLLFERGSDAFKFSVHRGW